MSLCAVGKNRAMYVVCGLDVAHLLRMRVLKGHLLAVHPGIGVRLIDSGFEVSLGSTISSTIRRMLCCALFV